MSCNCSNKLTFRCKLRRIRWIERERAIVGKSEKIIRGNEIERLWSLFKLKSQTDWEWYRVFLLESVKRSCDFKEVGKTEKCIRKRQRERQIELILKDVYGDKH